MKKGVLHHVEFYVSDLEESLKFWGWFLESMGYKEFQSWNGGKSWKLDDTYLVFVDTVKEFKKTANNRQGPGLNHIAFHGESQNHLDQLVKDLRERNINILKKDNEHICFEDPNNIAVEVFI